jgi:DNA invertase Pin-like site-specific DNA recombinase
MDTSITFSSKIKTSHLTRNAYLYIRQSTLRQVYENSESTKRQYALKGKIRAMGWPDSNIITIDTDLGQSGAESQDRVGFQKLVSEVGMGQAGIVIGIEVSRLSRSSADWIRLMEICAITDTLIMDEDGIYNVNDFNDRLLLGLKGTMSEAELHYLQARMRGGLLNKAKRGELQKPLPIGYIYNDYKQIVKDSDMGVQEAINIFFKTFSRVGSASGAVHEFNGKGLKFPLRLHKGFHKGELKWVQLVHSRSLQTLHNPMYAGIYTYGKTQIRHTVNGKKSLVMPKEEWHAYLRNSHPAYITEEDF